jgi:putative transposase
MPNYRRYLNEGYPYFLTTNVKNGRPIFIDDAPCRIITECITFLRKNMGQKVHAFVIMPNHVHLIATPNEKSNVSSFMHSFKLHTSHQLGKLLSVEGGIWQARFYERTLRDFSDSEDTFRYIHENPVKSGLVARPEEYRWSSYRASIMGEPIPIEVDPIV